MADTFGYWSVKYSNIKFWKYQDTINTLLKTVDASNGLTLVEKESMVTGELMNIVFGDKGESLVLLFSLHASLQQLLNTSEVTK